MKVRHSFSKRTGQRIDATNKHKQSFPKIVYDVIKISDIVLEVVDARFIGETRNPEIEDYIKKQGKLIIYVVNKSDLVDQAVIKKQLAETKIYPYVLISCKLRRGAKSLRDRIKIEAKKLQTSYKRIHVTVIGYPNTGKSSLINFITGKSSARTALESGFTKGIQKIKLASNILMLDTPGVIPLAEDSSRNQDDLNKHTQINVRTYDRVRNPDLVVQDLIQKYPKALEKFYGLPNTVDADELVENLGRKKKLLKKGNEVDSDRAARLILKDWQEGKIKVE